MNNWSDYLNERLIAKRDGYFVIKPKEEINVTPLACLICESLYRSKEDEYSHSEFGCCEKCAMKWAHPDRTRWHSGYRPTKEEVELEVLNRPKMTVTIA